MEILSNIMQDHPIKNILYHIKYKDIYSKYIFVHVEVKKKKMKRKKCLYYKDIMIIFNIFLRRKL